MQNALTTVSRRTRIMRALLVLPATSLAFALAGCADALPPGTTPAPGVQAGPGPRESLVTFVRPVSTCDTGEWAVVVDERGRFVGDVAAGTQISVVTSPGPHRFYAWGNIPLGYTEFGMNPVGAVRLTTRPGESAYVSVEPPAPCATRAAFELRAVSPEGPRAGELHDWLTATTPVTVDRDSRQRALDARPTHLQAHLELGEAKLRMQDTTNDRTNRHAKLVEETSATQ
jgi:hypothetical protein